MNVSTRNLQHIALEISLPPAEPGRLAIWEKRARAAIEVQLPGHTPLSGFLRVSMRAGVVDQGSPIARATGPILRLLDSAGVIGGIVSDTDARWDRIVPAGIVHLKIHQTTAPLARAPLAARRLAGERSNQHRAAERAAAA